MNEKEQVTICCKRFGEESEADRVLLRCHQSFSHTSQNLNLWQGRNTLWIDVAQTSHLINFNFELHHKLWKNDTHFSTLSIIFMRDLVRFASYIAEGSWVCQLVPVCWPSRPSFVGHKVGLPDLISKNKNNVTRVPSALKIRFGKYSARMITFQLGNISTFWKS